MGAAKTISQGNPPSDDTMRKYMTYQQEVERRMQERAGSQGNLSDAERRMQETEMRYRNQEPQMRSGINLGPGRANRTPEQGSREYEQLLQQVRRRNKGRRWVAKRCHHSFLSI